MRRLAKLARLALAEDAGQNSEAILAVVEEEGIDVGSAPDKLAGGRQTGSTRQAGIGGIHQRRPVVGPCLAIEKLRLTIEPTT